MRRLALLILVVLVGVGGFFWYRGDLGMWLAEARNALFQKKSQASLTPAAGRPGEAAVTPAVAVLPYREALDNLAAPAETDRIAAWIEVSTAYLNREPGARETVPAKLDSFIKTYVLSKRLPDDKKIAARVDVQKGDSLSSIAIKHRTTVEAIKRYNNLTSDVIRPGLTLKVLNQPVAVYVNKKEYRLWVTYGGKLLCEMSCGVGKDNRTPTGSFTVSERLVDPDWFPANGKAIPHGDPRNELGSRWIGFKDSGLGIHEARNPQDVGKASSNGCIRLLKEDVELLFDLVPLGTPVTIEE